MKQKLFPILCLALAALAVGCGKKDDSQVSAQALNAGTYVPAPAPGQPFPVGTPAPQIQGQYPYYYVNYRVDEASCSTGWRRFSGNDPGYVRALMCQSFQNNSMNQNCGHAQRAQWFASACQGF